MKDHQDELDQAAKDRADAAPPPDGVWRKRESALDTNETADEVRVATAQRKADELEARAMNRDPISGAVGSHPVGTAVGSTAGALAGAAIGTVVGPLGTMAGGVIGAVVGAAVGHTGGEAANPTSEDLYWRNAYKHEPYYQAGYDFDDYAGAYRAGYTFRNSRAGKPWGEIEDDLRNDWGRTRGASRLSWEQARPAAHAAWVHAGVRSFNQ